MRVSWSAIARLSLAVCARFALTWSEIMMDSWGRLRMVSSSGHGVLSKPTMLPRNSQATMPMLMIRNTHIDPQNLLTASAILSSQLVPRTCLDRTSLGVWSCGAWRISSARAAIFAAAAAFALTAAPAVAAVAACVDPGPCPSGGAIVSVMEEPPGLRSSILAWALTLRYQETIGHNVAPGLCGSRDPRARHVSV